MPRAIAISPHLDDAVFSCGGLIGALSDAGWSVTVVTVFTASVAAPDGFALACQLDKGLGPDVDYMAMRRAEDRQACAQLGAGARWLPFVEAPHRGYGSARALFGPRRAGDDVDRAVASSLGRIADEMRPDAILAPQAIGGHVDHRLTVRAIERLARGPIVWWRDFPYVSRGVSPAEPFADLMAKLPERCVAIDVARKARACAWYATQIGFQFGGEDGLRRALESAGGFERVRLDGALALP